MFGIRRNQDATGNAAPNHTGDYVTFYPHVPLPWLWWPGISPDSVIPFDKYPANQNAQEFERLLTPPTFVQFAGTLGAVGDGLASPFARGTIPNAMPQYPRR